MNRVMGVRYLWLVAALLGCASHTAPTTQTDLQVSEKMGEQWLYGQGLGETVLNLGATVTFPPYGAYLLGNGLLKAAGEDEIRVSDTLPEEDKKNWNQFYNEVTSAPGRLSSYIAGREFEERLPSNSSK